MKLIKLSIYSVAFLVLAMIGCQKEDVTNPNSLQNPLNRDAATCATQCIEEGGPYFELLTRDTVTYGNPNNPTRKYGTLTVYNTATELVFVVTSTSAIADLIFDGITTGLSAAANTPLTYSIALPAGWDACDIENHTIALAGSGPQLQFASTYYLVEVCACQYEGTALTGAVTNATDLGDGWWSFTVEYTFTTEEAQTGVKTQGGLTAGGNLGVRNVTASAGANIRYTNNNAVVNWVDDFAECSSKTYSITFERVFTGSGVITGEWTSKLADDTVLGTAAPLAY